LRHHPELIGTPNQFGNIGREQAQGLQSIRPGAQPQLTRAWQLTVG